MSILENILDILSDTVTFSRSTYEKMPPEIRNAAVGPSLNGRYTISKGYLTLYGIERHSLDDK